MQFAKFRMGGGGGGGGGERKVIDLGIVRFSGCRILIFAEFLEKVFCALV